jgi:hypothetical protein
MAAWFDELGSALKAVGCLPVILPCGDGRVMVLPHGARLLACELPGTGGNLFWHTPKACRPASLAPLIQSGAGLGGDRLWIAPEIAYMWKDLARARVSPFDCYTLPPAMDPGSYRLLEEGADHVGLWADMELVDHRFGRSIRLRVDRRFTVAGRPDAVPAEVGFAGFAIRNDLALLGGDDGAVAGAWDILQVPPGGTLICPTLSPVAQPRSYYNPFGPRHVRAGDAAVRFMIDGAHQIKMGLSPSQTTGRMGYHLCDGSGRGTLIVRLFLPQPGEPYVDLPRSSDEVFGGDAMQAYNDSGMFGGFGEMEYHEPALVVGRSPSCRSGTSVTYVMAGPDEAIREAGRRLLGPCI